MKVVIIVIVALTVVVAGAIGFVVATHGTAPGATPAPGSVDAAPIKTIARGNAVDLSDWIEPGVRTVFYFYADW